jgi:cellulose synthase/poly-beta-1,6-N-acetylglucosamine synthase-like glycosyltransferase
MLALRHPLFEVIVVDDGSRDSTFETLRAHFELVEVPRVVPDDVPTRGDVLSVHSPRGTFPLVVVRKANGGKASANNAGINVARQPLVCMVDADSLLEPDALLTVAKPFTDDPERVVATGGVVRSANGSTVTAGRITEVRMPRTWLPRIQVVEYLRAFLLGRSGWSALGALVVISGAFGLFRRDVLVEVGGLDMDTIGEDAELVVRLHRWLGDQDRDGRVVFVAEPVAWTEAPEDRAVLRKQRRRWHRGLTEVLTKHRTMLFRPRYGRVGMVSMPWFVAFELLAPFVEVFGVLFLGVALILLGLDGSGMTHLQLVNQDVIWLLLGTSLLYAVVLTLTALAIEELSFRRYRGLRDILIAIWAAFEENLGYRQLNAWWRVGGALEAWRRTKHDWGDMQRRGLGKT